MQSKLISSLRAPQRPLLDLGVGFSYELDTSDASLLVITRNFIVVCILLVT